MKRIIFRALTLTIISALMLSHSYGGRGVSAEFRVLSSKLGKTTSDSPQPSTHNYELSTKSPKPSALPSQRLAAQGPAQKAPKRDSCMIRSSRKAGTHDLVEVLLEVTGTIEQNENGKAKPEPFEAVAGFRYEERTEEYRTEKAPFMRSIRLYEQAGLKRRIGKATSKPLLDAARRYIICDYDGKNVIRYSPMGPLKNDQFLLLDELPCDSLLLDGLLPNREVKLGEEWGVSDSFLRHFLGLAAIENNTARLVLTAIIDDIAEVDLFLDGGKDKQGKPLPSTIQGTSLGVGVALDLQGKYQFDLRAGRMTWFGIRINERRGAGLIEPKLDSNALIRLKIAPLEQAGRLTDSVLKPLRVNATPDLLMLAYNGLNGPWRFRHEREWKMIEDTESSAALCLMMGGEGIAQCNILLNKKVDRNSMPSLEVYKDELKRGLSEKFGKIVKEDEFVNTDKYLVYTVTIDGSFDDLPFRWIYYLLTDPQGNQVTLMFEIRADFLDKFGHFGREILQSFQIIPPPEPAPTTGIDSRKES